MEKENTMAQSPTAERGADVRFPPPLVFLAAIFLGVVAQACVTALALPVDRAIRLAAGFLLILLGLGFGVPARVHFGRTGQHPAPWRPSPELILAGPYRLTRNPMYLGMSLIELGIGVAANNLWISALTLPALLIVHRIAVLPEERYLASHFGEPYATYCAGVRRYL
jgi:protein-S-isoprenylcysteine O-methyltransferase Ste14